ncbi:MAG: hypothetical protein ACRYG7_17235 [Janthinobacterium lividum]
MHRPLISPAWTIENTVTSEVFPANITRLLPGKRAAINKRDFNFDWKTELKISEIAEQQVPERQVYKLTTTPNPAIIHGLLSLSPAQGCVEMHLIESAKFNRGANKQYLRVAGNLITHACRLSYEWGNDGYVFFLAKTDLIDHYQRAYGAKRLGQSHQMSIDSISARTLLDRYYNGYLVNLI